MYTLFTLPIHLFNANPHYVRISCLTIRKKIPAAGFSNPTSKRHRSLYAVHKSSDAQRRLRSQRADSRALPRPYVH